MWMHAIISTYRRSNKTLAIMCVITVQHDTLGLRGKEASSGMLWHRELLQ